VTALSIIGSIIMPLPSLLWARLKTLLEKDTFYHRIRVEEDEEARYMYFDRTPQSAMNLKDPWALRLVYSRYTSLGFAFRPDAKKMLLIGLGGGSIPKKAQKVFPAMEIDAVEIDPEVVQIAKNHFNVRESKNLRIHAQDGRLFLTRTAHQYDIILLDAYYTDAMPFHLATKEFFELAQRKLTPNRRQSHQRRHRAQRKNRARLREDAAADLSANLHLRCAPPRKRQHRNDPKRDHHRDER
jgi:spermidine synthase